MKTVRFHELGPANVLRLEEVDAPTPGPGDLLVKVEAAGLNFSDIGKRLGRYLEPTPLPFTPGSEVCGEVVAVGPGVSGRRVGDRVAGVSPSRSGGYAEYALLPDHVAAIVPSTVSAEDALAVSNQGATAFHLLTTMARMAKGESVLVSAAGGGCGGLILQLARRFGAGMLIGLASTEAKREAAKADGANLVFDPADPDWPKEVADQLNGGVDIFLDSMGGELYESGLGLLGPFGRAVTYGLASGRPSPVIPLTLMRRCASVSGFHLDLIMERPGVMSQTLSDLYGLVAEGALKPRIAASFALKDAVAAHEFMESRAAVGKIIIRP
ncbi:MAG: zinc-binding dehydrogenase [Phenylobacterium sp.]|uniref:quinone oxidoreductase family protein n=1 Tax=Phenylobacterium sp. TaxID=1871053 RepID=UPI0025DE1BBC|nr:zinc-binding dehydrogenase [Phenylobacterium sp.]MCA3727562.1 zinc-binding dehydrogenase [Phenylobacterium sp.]MCA6243402.1 zinc-binding dehydrogenase [Phenylobacterium sp.]MCA6271019.1 zinc-binding dehydrogenase [Phenylobacterium sp.]MCA6276219.1 zinc-binding dehydrogenase [Phenylobacterium sp.]MCA6295288.1 zinc-binding dehydrogenase [Phenylobacterium sp.]